MGSSKEYYQKHKKERIEHTKKYNELHKKERNEYNKKYRKEQQTQINHRRRLYYQQHRKEEIQRSINYNRNFKMRIKKRISKTRMIVLEHYTNGTTKCQNIYNLDHSGMENDPDYICALEIDHKNRNEKSSERLHGDKLCRWLIKNDFPEGFQILCPTCNTLKRIKDRELGYRKVI